MSEGQEGNAVEPIRTRNAMTASEGNKAEHIVCDSPEVRAALSEYLKRKIVSLEVIVGRKKSDITVTFEDGHTTTAQLKNGTGGGRGWSVDRRSVDKYPERHQELLRKVCLRGGGERNEVASDSELVSKLFLGEKDGKRPEWFIHTTVKNGKIESLSICPAALFIETLQKGLYAKVNPKRTCVHLSDLIYLQRKGGGKKDRAPNDIQAKLRKMPDCMTTLSLTPVQTTPPPQEQTP